MFVRLFAVAAIFALLVAANPASAGVGALEKRWSTAESIRVCFLNGNHSTQSKVRSLANEWTKGTGVRFEFAPAGACTERYAIRVSFRGRGYWSYVGTDARNVGPNQPTMNLEVLGDGVEDDVAGLVLQQFGHALGLLHQEQDPVGECRKELNEALIQDRTKWSKEMLEINTSPVVPNDGRGMKLARTLVKRLNPDMTSQFTPSGELPRSFIGRLELPSRAYRLSVEYGDLVTRRRIEQAVERVKNARAAALRVTTEQIAITITDPTGNPKVQQARTILTEPGPGYADALRAMKYPFVDQASEESFAGFQHRVHVAVWDTHVDAKHCEFRDETGGPTPVITPTLSGISTDEQPPDESTDCGHARNSTYRPKVRWDHGTHVAGLIAAQVNGRGIAGVNPWARVWAWEVIHGDQFKDGRRPFLQLKEKADLDPVVINISQSFEIKTGTNKSDLEVLLFGEGSTRGIHNRRLIVAPAGVFKDENNKAVGRQIDATFECFPAFNFPACWSNADGPARNIISVVALNRDGTDLLKDGTRALTDHGGAFDVSAVGDAVSTMHGHWVGSMQGSSFAAPYVTGLASLLIAKVSALNLNFTIPELKHRILTTADRDPPLDKTSRFGKINFARALDFENDVILLRGPAPPSSAPSLSGFEP